MHLPLKSYDKISTIVFTEKKFLVLSDSFIQYEKKNRKGWKDHRSLARLLLAQTSKPGETMDS